MFPKIEYEQDIPSHLFKIVPKQWLTFVEDSLHDLIEVKSLVPGQYVGESSKQQRNGQGMMIMDNGDIYKGSFKDNKRHGPGLCQFSTGAIYKGEWKDDKPHGNGLLFSGNNELIDTKFDKGYIYASGPSEFQVSPGKVRLLLSDGSYYQG